MRMLAAGMLVGLVAMAAAGADNVVAVNPEEAGPDYAVQGEYEGTAGEAKLGVQVIALGDGHVQAVFLPGGLPGAGWNEKERRLLQGRVEGGKVALAPAEGNRTYMGKKPEEFSATKKFPPEGHRPWTAAIEGTTITGKTAAGTPIAAKKVLRRSPTLGQAPPAGAIVLLAYKEGEAPSLEAWTNDKWKTDPACGCMQVVAKRGGTKTKEKIEGGWTMHLEFKTPFMPSARSQGRGNSGVFPPGGREIQVLDSFGLEGLPNECGGIYKSHSPRVPMCLPPLSWQTYDVEYHPAEGDAPAWYKVAHNGVVIHEKLELTKDGPGTLSLQDHGNPVSYRNIWLVKK